MPRRMSFIKKSLHILSKVTVSVLFLALAAVIVTGVTVIYDFEEPKPFEGPDIFNPYRNFNRNEKWKKANFHVHTRVEGILNECEYWPGEVYEFHKDFGYDIVTFSNHNELTLHPFDTALQVNVYEHGYNLFKFHKLVFGSGKVNRFDHLLPLTASHRQFQLDILHKDCDIIQFNHPLRTTGTSRKQMQKLSGYDIMELDCGKSTENEFWDWALSAGHYCFGLANDDLHYPDRSSKFARRCNFIQTPSGRYDDLKKALAEGCYYSMRIPDYGNGDWEIKRKRNLSLPYIKEIGLADSTIYIAFSQMADSIKIYGQDHSTLAFLQGCMYALYTMQPNDRYARITAYFPGGEVIYTNPFARYDATKGDRPSTDITYKANIPLTIIFNSLLLALLTALSIIYYRYITRRKP